VAFGEGWEVAACDRVAAGRAGAGECTVDPVAVDIEDALGVDLDRVAGAGGEGDLVGGAIPDAPAAGGELDAPGDLGVVSGAESAVCAGEVDEDAARVHGGRVERDVAGELHLAAVVGEHGGDVGRSGEEGAMLHRLDGDPRGSGGAGLLAGKQ